MAIGGAEDKVNKRAILSRFVELAGGSDARIVVIPAASALPRERGELYSSLFEDLGAGEVSFVQIETRRQATSRTSARRIREATAVFLTGGVQLRLVALLGGTPVGRAIHELVASGGVYAGTSAGAAAISSQMILTGSGGMRVRRSMVDLSPGLGLVDDVIIDQHFSQRGRFGRLMAAVGLNPHYLGVGVDEDTAAIFHRGGTVEIVGTSQVVIVDASRVIMTNVHRVTRTSPISMSGLQLHLLTDGDRFDLTHRKLILPSKSKRISPGRKS